MAKKTTEGNENKAAAPKTNKAKTTPAVETAKEPVIDASEKVEEEIIEAPKAETVEEAFENVNTELGSPVTEEEVAKIEESVEAIAEIEAEAKEVEEGKAKLEDVAEKEPEKMEETINEEIKKADNLLNKVNKIISKPKPRNITSWWNGMGYDF